MQGIGVPGRAKVADKIQLIMNLLDKYNIMFIAGDVAFKFINELDVVIGSSLHDKEGATLVPDIGQKAWTRYSQSA